MAVASEDADRDAEAGVDVETMQGRRVSSCVDEQPRDGGRNVCTEGSRRGLADLGKEIDIVRIVRAQTVSAHALELLVRVVRVAVLAVPDAAQPHDTGPWVILILDALHTGGSSSWRVTPRQRLVFSFMNAGSRVTIGPSVPSGSRLR